LKAEACRLYFNTKVAKQGPCETPAGGENGPPAGVPENPASGESYSETTPAPDEYHQ